MSSRAGRGQPRSVVGKALLLGIAVITAVGTSVAGARPGRQVASSSGPPSTSITLAGPARAPLRRNVSFRLLANAPRAIGPFQANLGFDDGALEVVRIRTP